MIDRLNGGHQNYSFAELRGGRHMPPSGNLDHCPGGCWCAEHEKEDRDALTRPVRYWDAIGDNGFGDNSFCQALADDAGFWCTDR
jgi:hypothetical protein